MDKYPNCKLGVSGIISNLLKGKVQVNASDCDFAVRSCLDILSYDVQAAMKELAVIPNINSITFESLVIESENPQETALSDKCRVESGRLEEIEFALEILAGLLVDHELLNDEGDQQEADEEGDEDMDEGEDEVEDEGQDEDDDEEWEDDEGQESSQAKVSAGLTLDRLIAGSVFGKISQLCNTFSLLNNGFSSASLFGQHAVAVSVKACECLTNIFGLMNSDIIKTSNRPELDALFMQVLLMVDSIFTSFPGPAPDSIEGLLLKESLVGVAAALARAMTEELSWPLGESCLRRDSNFGEFLTSWTRWYSSSFPAALTKPDSEKIMENIRMHLVVLLDTICLVEKLPEQIMVSLGDFLVSRLESGLGLTSGAQNQKANDIPAEKCPLVAAEILNLSIIFGQDQYDQWFESQQYLNRLVRLSQPLKAAVKAIDPRKDRLVHVEPENGHWTSEISTKVDISMKSVRGRLWDMYQNLSRFIQYKQEANGGANSR